MFLRYFPISTPDISIRIDTLFSLSCNIARRAVLFSQTIALVSGSNSISPSVSTMIGFSNRAG